MQTNQEKRQHSKLGMDRRDAITISRTPWTSMLAKLENFETMDASGVQYNPSKQHQDAY